MESVMKAHLAVERAAADQLPYPFFYHVDGSEVVGITVGVTPDRYENINIKAYTDIAAALRVPFNIIERKKNDHLLNEPVFGEVFDLGKVESDLFEDIRFSEFVSQAITNRAQGRPVRTFAVGNVDEIISDYLDAERLPQSRYDFEGYAVIDFETTGFKPEQGERAIEIAIVHLDPTGEYQDHWDTLVNPDGRPAGATDIHRITDEMLLTAPRIDDVVLAWGALLQNRKVISHNKRFDHPFLKYEFLNSGYDQPLEYDEMLCSLIWARNAESQYSTHKLIDCCTRSGIELVGAHEAIYDTLATGKLFGHYLKKYGESYPLTGKAVQPSLTYVSGMDQIENFVSRADLDKKKIL